MTQLRFGGGSAPSQVLNKETMQRLLDGGHSRIPVFVRSPPHHCLVAVSSPRAEPLFFPGMIDWHLVRTPPSEVGEEGPKLAYPKEVLETFFPFELTVKTNGFWVTDDEGGGSEVIDWWKLIRRGVSSVYGSTAMATRATNHTKCALCLVP